MSPRTPDHADDLLSELLAAEGFVTEAATEAPITRRDFAGPAPAGFGQELIWMLDRAAPGTTAYNIGVSRRIIGPLDVGALTRSLDEIIRRHEVFRTTFEAGTEYPVQVVHEPRPVELLRVDLRRLRPTDREDASRRTLEERLRAPFDLGRDQLLRATLVQVDDEEYCFLLQTHHIAYDGWSGRLILREIGELYAAHTAGRTASLAPTSPIRYRDYAAWERERLQGPRLAELLKYWQAQLADVPTSLELPTDRPRDAAPRFEGGQVDSLLPGAALEGIKRLAQEHGATLYMALLAAFQTVLHRWSGQAVIVTGSAAAGRTRPETEGVVGYLANTLVLRTSFENDPSFAALLERVRDTAVGAYDHQDIPLEKLVLELRRDRVGSPTPLFQAVLTMQDVTGGGLSLTGLTLQPLRLAVEATKFDLTLFPAERPDGLRLALAYRSDIFDMATAQRFLGHLQSVLESAVAAPETAVSALPLLTAAERLQLAAWNQTGWDEGPAATVTALFEAQAARHPDRIAVRSDDGALSYVEVDARANRIAAWLLARGAGAGTPVGLCLDRSTAMITGLLGVLKAGGCYVPLAPDQPPARLAQQIAEAGLRLAVTAEAHRALLPSDIQALSLDGDASALAGLSSAAPRAMAHPADPAYVLFTSGSTGVPKGVVVTHANLVHYTRAIARVLGLDLSGGGQPWHCATVSTLAADLGNTAIFPALLSGGTLHVLTAGTATDAARFAEYAEAQPFDLLKITPNHLRALLAGRNPTAILPKRWLVVGGEACPWDLADAVRHAGTCRMLNHYGPTETTVGVCTYEVGARLGGPEVSATVPIGLPLANTRARVLDARGLELPVGVPGELYIGGDGVALGYLNRPELTAEKFVADPWAADTAARVYRTGDRVRRLATGDLQFLGRVDDQVKIRGFRVEPGEVEALLSRQPGVKQAAVTAQADAQGGVALVAYVVADPSLTSAALAATLSQRLPDPMVPTVWVRLETLPLTSNGKVDRRALPSPEPYRSGSIRADDTPRNGTEIALGALWAEVLKRDAVGIHEDFFTLGGHSLLAIRLLGRVAKTFGQRLTLRTLFDHPTVAKLSLVLAPAHPGETALASLWAEVLKRERVERNENFFALGGHSLLAIRLLGRIAKQFGVRLALRTLFDHPTVAMLAPVIAAARDGEAPPAPVPAAPATGAIARRTRTAIDAPGASETKS